MWITSLSGKSTTGTKIRAGVFSSKYFSRYSCSPKIQTKQIMNPPCLIVSYLLRMVLKYFSENYCGVAINKRNWNATLKFSLYIEGKSPTSFLTILRLTLDSVLCNFWYLDDQHIIVCKWNSSLKSHCGASVKREDKVGYF